MSKSVVTMSVPQNLLDSEPNILEKNLRFVKNEFEEELRHILGEQQQFPPPRDSKVVTPLPGMCIKSFKLNTNEKFFINLCQTDELPPPEDISEDDLVELLQSDTPTSYKVPMSISEPRTTKDNSGKKVEVCDIAISPKFFKKCEEIVLFRDFLVTIILEALSEKYNIQIKTDNWLVLKNCKVKGNLVRHRIQNRDVKTVYENYKNLSEKDKEFLRDLDQRSGKNLIQELKPNEASAIKQKSNKGGSSQEINTPEYRIVAQIEGLITKQLVAEIFLPKCLSATEINLDVGEDRILVEATKHGYVFDKFLPYKIDQSNVSASFNKTTKMLLIKLHVQSSV